MITNLQQLKQLAIEDKKRKHPDFPYPVAPKYSDKDANGLTSCIVDFITFSGGWATRVNTQGQYREGIGWTTGSTALGTPDIIGCLHSNFFGVEVKIGKDRQSDHQKKVEESINNSGGYYIIARSYDEFIEKYNAVI